MDEKGVKMEIPILILAGGQGKRMGYRNKAQLQINKQTFLEKILAEFHGIPCYLSTRPSYTPELSGVKLILDQNSDRGPVEGILQAFQQTDHEAFFVIGCDMPLMKREVYDALCANVQLPKGVAIQTKERLYTLGAIYTRSMVEEMVQNVEKKDYRLKLIFQNEYSDILTAEQVEVDLECFMNINFEEDYKQFCNRYLLIEGE